MACPDPFWVPLRISPTLRVLTLSLRCDAHTLDLSDLFAALCACPALEELGLTFWYAPPALPARLSCPPSLQRLQLRLHRASRRGRAQLGLLGTAAAARLSISLLVTGQGLLHAVPRTCQLYQLCFVATSTYATGMQRELARLQSQQCTIECGESCRLEVLPRARFLALDMNISMDWPLLAGSARCLAMNDHHVLTVAGCTGSTPEHAQPWAIFLRSPACAHGLSQHHFVLLGTGWWAWRNRAAVVQALDRPEQWHKNDE